MIAPAAGVKVLLVTVVGELVAIAVVQANDGNTVLLIAAMSSFVAFVGVMVTGFVTYSGQKAAERERTAKAKEDREAHAEVIKTVDVGNVSIGKVEHAVNSEQSAVKEELRASRAATAAALATIADLTKKYELLVANVTRPAPITPSAPVDVILKQEP